MLEKLLLVPLLLTFAAAGLMFLLAGLENLRVLLASFFWPRTPGSYLRSYVSTDVKSFRSDGDVERYHLAAGAEVFHGFLTSTVTKRSHYLHLIYRYTVGNRTYTADSLAQPWNHTMAGQTGSEGDATARDEALKARSLQIRYNPRQPQEHLRGYASFPYLLTLIQLIVGLFLALGLSAALSQLTELFGLTEPRFGAAQRSLYVLIPPVLAGLWLLWRLLRSSFGNPTQRRNKGPKGRKQKHTAQTASVEEEV